MTGPAGVLALLLVCLGGGMAIRRGHVALAARISRVLVAYVVRVALPAITLVNVRALDLRGGVASWLPPVLMAWIVFALAAAVFFGAARVWGWPRPRVGALLLTAGMCNTSFVGYPLVVALFGQRGLPVAVLADQAGSFLLLSTLAPVAGAACAATPQRLAWTTALRKVVLFPPFVAFVMALATRELTYPALLVQALGAVGATLGPLALLAVGTQVEVSRAAFAGRGRALAAGLTFKLALAPAVIAGLYLGVVGLRGEVVAITVVQAATPPMVTGAVLASELGLEPELGGLLLAVGIPVGLATASLWGWVLCG